MAIRFWVGGTGTWDNADTTHWSTTTGGGGGASVPVAGDVVNFDAASGGGTVTVNHATLSVFDFTMSAFTGTLDFSANNNNITITGTFTCTGSSTRTLNMGNGTWTLNNNGIGGQATTLWNCFGVTNFTLNANSSTLQFTGSQNNASLGFNPGGLTYNNVTFNPSLAGASWLEINDDRTSTYNNFTISGNAGGLMFIRGSGSITVNGALSISGTSSKQLSIQGKLWTNGAGNNTITVANANSLSWVAIGGITKAGAGSITANNSFDLGGNTGVTITGPSAAGGGLRMAGHGGLAA